MKTTIKEFNRREVIIDDFLEIGTTLCIENPEATRKWGNINDWHHAISTGPFILKDFIPGNSATFVRNSNYSVHDEHYPQNHLPYIDTLKILIIPNKAGVIEALCAGKIDALDRLLPFETEAIKKTNRELLQVIYPAPDAHTLDPRNDVKPFNDTKVRKSMQMPIDLPTIYRNYYKDTCRPYPSSLTSRYMKGWGFSYEE